MNRPVGAVPQTMRGGMPGGFGSQQQQQQQPQLPGRSVSGRLPPNGKMANNNSGWAFGGGVPMGNAGLPNPARQMGGNISFAQSLSGSQAATPLDPSEFPSLSNNAQMPIANQSSMWSAAGTRNLSGPVQRNQGTPLPSQQTGHDDIYSGVTSRMPSYRYGGQVPVSSQGQGAAPDDFPPLNRSGNGEMQFNQGEGNGLLNALSASNRANDVRSPPGIGAPGLSRPELPNPPPGLEDEVRRSSPRDGGGGARTTDDSPASRTKENRDSQAPEGIDPLSGMAAADKWGMKGLRMLMNNHPDYHAMIVGIDPNAFGLEMGSQELISNQMYSLFDESPPRPIISETKLRLPDCYNVTNVQPLPTKLQSFGEETLFWIFYSRPMDLAQQMAAAELHSRNWRWHRKLRIWLTKDEHMQPTLVTQTYERGYYIVWDAQNWRKDRREFTLYYNDLEGSLNPTPAG